MPSLPVNSTPIPFPCSLLTFRGVLGLSALLAALLLRPAPARAATYEWTAGGDGVSLYQEANWTLLGGSTTIPQINPNTDVNQDLIVEVGAVGGGGGASAHLQLGTGTLTVNGGTFRMNISAGAGIKGGTITLNGGKIITQFLQGLSVTLSSGELELHGSGNPVNNSTLNFMANATAVVHFLSEPPANVRSEHLSKITVAGQPGQENVNLAVTDDGASGTLVTIWVNTDTDGDGLTDGWELQFFGDLSRDGTDDYDGDGLTDQEEFARDTNPIKSDSDGDLLHDGEEAGLGTDPLVADSDGDGTPDGLEQQRGTDPLNPNDFPRRPNVVFILVDDLGYGDLGCFWQDFKTGTQKFDTPNLDRMAADGMKLTHHYIGAPVCAPARGSFLQGRHQGHCDIRNNQFDKALPANHTIASVLQAAGYYTVHIGKNGLAGGENSADMSGTGSRSLAAHPLHRGFDRFFGYLFHNDGHEHYPRNGTTDKIAHIFDDYQRITGAYEDVYTTDAWTAFAKKTIIEATANHPSRPFFIYLAYDTPHQKMQYPPTPYPAGGGLSGGVQWTGFPGFCNTAVNNPAAVNSTPHPSVDPAWPASQKQHVSMIRRIDDGVGDILQTLRELGIADNTLVVFTSDNGPHNENHDPRFFESFANMEGIKRDMWEAGIRVPTIAWWPGHVPTNSVSAFPSGIWDWLPTVLELAGLPAPAIADGVSLIPTLTGTGTQRDKGYLYFEYQVSGSTPNWTSYFPHHAGETRGEMQCLRLGDYMGIRTAIRSGADDFRIYDVVHDPGQGTNLAPALPQLHQRMKELALQVRMPGGGVSRPYDAELLAPSSTYVSNGVLAYAVFEGRWGWVPEFTAMTPVTTGVVAGLDLSVKTRAQDVGILFTGFIVAPADGAYTFYLTSDSGAALRIHDAHVIDDDFNHTGAEVSGTVRLRAGHHPLRLYYRHGTGSNTLVLQYAGPGIAKQVVPVSAFGIAGALPAEPQLNDDEAATALSVPVDIDVLANDLDDGQPGPLRIVAVQTPASGTTAIVGNRVRYTPNAGFLGADAFTYTATDGQFTNTAQVVVTVHYVDGLWWYPFNQTAGVTTFEAGGGRPGRLIGFANDPTQWVAGRDNRALQFTSANNQYVSLDNFMGILGAADRTCAAWIQTTNAGQLPIIAWGPNTSGNKWTFLVNGGTLRLEVTSGYVHGDTPINDGQWHHVACTFANDGTPNALDVQLYVDGHLETNFVATSGQTINTTAAQPVKIGSDIQNRYFNGLIDEVRIYDRALSPAEIAALATAPDSTALAWHRRYFGAAPVDWLADDDADGGARLLEHALGGQPHLPDTERLGVTAALVNGRLQVTHRRLAAGTHQLVYTLLVSGDLAAWTAANATELNSAPTETPEVEQVTWDLGAIASGSTFVRLQVEPAP